MASEAVALADRIVQSGDGTNGRPVVKSTKTPVDLVLARLAANPSIEELLREHQGMTLDDVRAVFAYAGAQIGILPAASSTVQRTSSFVSPQEFYREAVKRPDVRRILDALAK